MYHFVFDGIQGPIISCSRYCISGLSFLLLGKMYKNKKYNILVMGSTAMTDLFTFAALPLVKGSEAEEGRRWAGQDSDGGTEQTDWKLQI